MSVDLVVRNLQRLRKIDVRYLRRITLAILEDELKAPAHPDSGHFAIGIHIVNAGRMTGLNRRFMGHDGSTDVITLEYDKWKSAAMEGNQMYGEVFVCMDEAIAQAKRFHTTWQSELVRYLIHGFLHLRGHDDLKPAARRLMKQEEARLLKNIARRFPLQKLARKAAAGKE